ncbi:MAG: hypothetical protein ACI4TC_09100 [Kiritimatiellia bacterium]
MISWGWRNRRSYGLRDYAPRWLRPISAAVPWLTVGLLFQMICLLGGTLTTSEGLLFALPEEGRAGLVEQKDLEEASLVALLLPTPQGTLVFFDDTRYVLDDDVQMARFAERLRDRVKTPGADALLALADRRISWGHLHRFGAYVRTGGVGRIQFAQKKGRDVFE